MNICDLNEKYNKKLEVGKKYEEYLGLDKMLDLKKKYDEYMGLQQKVVCMEKCTTNT